MLAVSSGSSAMLQAVGQDLTPDAAAHVQGFMRKDIEQFADAMRARGLAPDALRNRSLSGAEAWSISLTGCAVVFHE